MTRELVIDNEPILAELIGAAFRDDGYETDVVYGGHDGMRLFALHHHGVVVTDIMMPDFDGLEVIRAIRKLDPKSMTTVLAISSAGMLDCRVMLQTARKFGAAAGVEKPFLPTDLAELATTLRTACNPRDMHAA